MHLAHAFLAADSRLVDTFSQSVERYEHHMPVLYYVVCMVASWPARIVKLHYAPLFPYPFFLFFFLYSKLLSVTKIK